MVQTWRARLSLVLGLLGLAGLSVRQTADVIPPAVDIEVFTRAGCPRCAAAKRFLDDLQHEQPGLRIVVHDVGQDPTALARLQDLAAKLGVQALGVPAFALRGALLIGFLSAPTTGRQLKALLDGSVLKVEMAVASKGLTINKTNAYGKCRVTYLHI
jgi:glutaredoxin